MACWADAIELGLKMHAVGDTEERRGSLPYISLETYQHDMNHYPGTKRQNHEQIAQSRQEYFIPGVVTANAHHALRGESQRVSCVAFACGKTSCGLRHCEVRLATSLGQFLSNEGAIFQSSQGLSAPVRAIALREN